MSLTIRNLLRNSLLQSRMLRKSQEFRRFRPKQLSSNCSYSSDSKQTEVGKSDVHVSEEEKAKNEPLIVKDRIEKYHIMTIGINRPEKRNCVNSETAQCLLDAFHEFEADEEMYSAVLHGIGGNFSAGYDLEELSEFDENFAEKVAHVAMDRGPMGPTRLEFTKPVIAAINGYAVAGGLELALMCDMRIVEESAQLGILSRRFGVPLIDGGSVRLPELIGLSRALDLILTGRIISGREAFDIGLANRVVTDGASFGQAMELAKEINKFPQGCLRVDRASAYFSIFSSASLADSLQNESDNGVPILVKESVEGAKKFLSGKGKHGKFNVNMVGEPEEWQKEFEEMKNKHESEKSDK